MGVPKIDLWDTRLDLMNKGSMEEFIYRRMVLFINSCWFYITNSLFFIVRFITSHVFRIKLEDSYRRDDSNASSMKESKSLEPVVEATEEEEMDYDAFEEKETSSFSFKFQYQFSEDTTRSIGEHTNHVTDENTLSTTTDISKYRFLTEKDLSGFVKESEAMTLRLQESFFDFKVDNKIDEEKLDAEFTPRFLLAKDFQQSNTFNKFNKLEESKDLIIFKNKFSETNSIDEKEVLDGVRFLSEGFSGFDSDSESVSDGYSVKNLVVDSDSDGFLSEDDFGGYERESDTTETSIHSDRYKVEVLEDIGKFDRQLQSLYNLDTKSEDSGCGSVESVLSKNQANYADIDDGLLEPENKAEDNLQNSKGTQLTCSSAVQIEFTDSSDDQLSSFRTDSTRLSCSDEVFSMKDLTGPERKPDDLDGEEAGRISRTQSSELNHFSNLRNSDTGLDALTSRLSAPTNSLEQVDANRIGRDSNKLVRKPEDPRAEDSQKPVETHLEDLDSEDLYELESLWEHQELIEQLKMELKKVRAVGLPTILEESESPKTPDDLKPWKIDEKFLNEDPMDELHKFYKSYRERMRKFDILNYQKMYAIGFLHLKDPLQSMGTQKPLIPTVMLHLSQNFKPFCFRKSNSDPSAKFLKELQRELETVYVGQTCLSWEFLRWQYEKARGLPESDPYRSHQYNQVAGEFQQFQVVTQRFIENESFQGPRLPNYVKNRCVLRNLLQIPVIKEDCSKDKMEGQRKGDGAITSEMLEDIMEESIRIFWEFVKADKNETPAILKGLIGAQAELQDPSDYKLMVDIQANLQKKDKKLKDILRTGNCLVKKFKKPQEDRSNQDLFFSQVDMKLVSMVLKMSRITTDQLLWCHKKLNKITFAERKIQREPSFLLFPC